MASATKSSSNNNHDESSSSNKEEEEEERDMMDEPLKFVGFQMDRMTAQAVEGRFVVSSKSCQPFGLLHGGVSALIAEALASLGAYAATKSRVAGVQLTINHLKAATIGTEVFASAKPVQTGRRLHVWDVTFSAVAVATRSEMDKNPRSKVLAISRVTVMVGLPDKTDEYDRQLTTYSRL